MADCRTLFGFLYTHFASVANIYNICMYTYAYLCELIFINSKLCENEIKEKKNNDNDR